MIELLSLVVYFVTHKIMIITLYKKRKCFSSTFQIMTTDMRFKKNKLLNLKLSLKKSHFVTQVQLTWKIF